MEYFVKNVVRSTCKEVFAPSLPPPLPPKKKRVDLVKNFKRTIFMVNMFSFRKMGNQVSFSKNSGICVIPSSPTLRSIRSKNYKAPVSYSANQPTKFQRNRVRTALWTEAEGNFRHSFFLNSPSIAFWERFSPPSHPLNRSVVLRTDMTPFLIVTHRSTKLIKIRWRNRWNCQIAAKPYFEQSFGPWLLLKGTHRIENSKCTIFHSTLSSCWV